MAQLRTIRDTAIAVIAAALRENSEADPMDAANATMQETGLRRAMWATLSEAERKRLVGQAQRVANLLPR